MTIPTASRWRLYFPLGGGSLVYNDENVFSESTVAASPVEYANTFVPRDTQIFRFINFGELSMAAYAGGPNLCQTIGGTSSAYREGSFIGGYTSNHDTCFDDFVPADDGIPAEAGPIDYWSPNNAFTIADRFNWIEFSFFEPVSVAEYGISNCGLTMADYPFDERHIDGGLQWDFQYLNGDDVWVTVDSRIYEKLPAAFNYFTVPGAIGPMNVAQSVVEVLRSNGTVYGARVNQMAVEVLRYNGIEGDGGIGGVGGTRDPIPGENPAVTNWFSLF